MRICRLYFITVIMLLLVVGSVSADNWFSTIFGQSKGVKGSDDLVTEERDVKPFNKIVTSGAYDITVVVGEKQSVKITFDDNLVEIVQTEVKGKTLRIFSDKSYRSQHDCLIEITVPELKEVVAKGSGDIVIENLKGDFFEYDLRGSGDVELGGEVDELEINLAGSGDIDTRNLIAKDAFVAIRGSGDVRVYASDSFDGAVYGSGDIDFYGNPDNVSKHIAGSGSIKRRR